LQQIISRGEDLPTLPTIVLQLHRALDDPRAGPARVAQVIEQDPALTTRLLRVVNSALYSSGGPRLTSVHAAVSKLGMNQVRATCLVLAVVKAFGKRTGHFDHEEFWSHSATVAELASRLWARVGKNRAVTAEDAYVVGLLHDVGLLIIDQHFPDELNELLVTRDDDASPLSLLEEAQMGIDHGAVAGLLLGRWSLPTFIADAISHHNHPQEAPDEFRQLAMVLAAAEAMCWELDLGLPIEGRPVEPAAVWLRGLGVPAHEVRGIIAETEQVHLHASGFLA
jgi:HD-like signal output (HDOD) protein